jgi:hypothetical protein
MTTMTPLPPDTPGDSELPDLPDDGPQPQDQAVAAASADPGPGAGADPLTDRGLADARAAEERAIGGARDTPPPVKDPDAETDTVPRKDPDPGRDWKLPPEDIRTPETIADEVRGRIEADLALGGNNGPGR